MASEGPPRRPAPWTRQFALAMELPFILAGSIFVGGLFGYLVDRWAGTFPLFTLLLAILGLIAGVRDMLRRLAKSEKSANRDREQ